MGFADGDEQLTTLVRKNMGEMKKLPTKEQLQAFAKKEGKPIKYSEVAPLLKSFRTKLLNAFLESRVTVVDTYGTATVGTLADWSETNEKWMLDVWPSVDTRIAFKSDKLPIF